jgi:hypothetical protein
LCVKVIRKLILLACSDCDLSMRILDRHDVQVAGWLGQCFDKYTWVIDLTPSTDKTRVFVIVVVPKLTS